MTGFAIVLVTVCRQASLCVELNMNGRREYCEIIADKLSAAGWSWGYRSAVTRDGWRWIVDAHREGRRYIVHSDELLSAFLELEAMLL
jgi:hypothetical protein